MGFNLFKLFIRFLNVLTFDFPLSAEFYVFFEGWAGKITLKRKIFLKNKYSGKGK
ncbi:hypothetical protein [Methanosarcina sp. KYL-1]|uniref:hypothetical protein n=1 Tax=Methanosarcina sp. KYL-1 TaxID=2602068 RepID=UPI0021017411|nr:hypothetical protein [Methanosarcina sp. KYL-1]